MHLLIRVVDIMSLPTHHDRRMLPIKPLDQQIDLAA